MIPNALLRTPKPAGTPPPGYWTELDLQNRFSDARDRLAARGTNARFADQDAMPFGSLPPETTTHPTPLENAS